MERKEFAIIAKTIRSVYPNMLVDDDSKEVWFTFLKDMDYKEASAALARHICTSKFPPTIADLREQFVNNSNIGEMNGEQAWSIVYKAMENSAYGYKEEFDKLPPLLQKCVGSAENLHELALMDSDTVNSVEKSHFIRIYGVEQKRQKEFDSMPESVKQLIEQTSTKMIEG